MQGRETGRQPLLAVRVQSSCHSGHQHPALVTTGRAPHFARGDAASLRSVAGIEYDHVATTAIPDPDPDHDLLRSGFEQAGKRHARQRPFPHHLIVRVGACRHDDLAVTDVAADFVTPHPVRREHLVTEVHAAAFRQHDAGVRVDDVVTLVGVNDVRRASGWRHPQPGNRYRRAEDARELAGGRVEPGQTDRGGKQVPSSVRRQSATGRLNANRKVLSPDVLAGRQIHDPQRGPATEDDENRVDHPREWLGGRPRSGPENHAARHGCQRGHSTKGRHVRILPCRGSFAPRAQSISEINASVTSSVGRSRGGGNGTKGMRRRECGERECGEG